MGDPCAGQIKAIDALCFRSSKLIFLLWTIGGALPMGSNKKQNYTKSSLNLTHLNAGIGIPWAGQTRSNFSPKDDSIAFNLMFTLGAALPTGSVY